MEPNSSADPREGSRPDSIQQGAPVDPAGDRLQQLCEAILQVYRREAPPENPALAHPGQIVRSEVARELVPRLEEGLRCLAGNLRQELTLWLRNVEELERISGAGSDASLLAKPDAERHDGDGEEDPLPLLKLTAFREPLAGPVSPVAPSPPPISETIADSSPADGKRSDELLALDKPAIPPPSPGASFFKRGQIHLQKREIDRAIDDFTEVVNLDSEHADAFLNRGRAYRLGGDPESALGDFSRVLELRPDDADALNNRGNAHADLGRNALAVADYTAALRLDPQLCPAYINRALLFVKKGKFDLAVADGKRAADIDPHLAQAYFVLGVAHAGQGNHDQAIADFTCLLELMPESALAYNERGLAYCAKTAYESAVADFTAALRLEPHSVLARYHRGIALRLNGELKRGILDFTNVLRLEANHALAHYQRGLARESANQPALALADYSRAVELDSDLEDAAERRNQLLQVREQRPVGKKPASAPGARPPLPTEQPFLPPDQTKQNRETANAQQGLITLSCECGASTQVTLDRLGKQFLCRSCHRLYRVGKDGQLAEIRPKHPQDDRRLPRLGWQELRWFLAVALVLAILVGCWFGWKRFGERALEPLPIGLEARAELMGKAWLNGDLILIRRLTSSSHSRKLSRWRNEHPSPLAASERNRVRTVRQTVVEVRIAQTRPDGSELILNVKHPTLQEVKLAQFWVKEGDSWFFVPFAETGPPRERKTRRFP